jgi:hypothetical protein
MVRTLRSLAISGLVATGVYLLADYLLEVGHFPLQYYSAPWTVVIVVGQTGFYLGFATGIIAIVTCVQQQQRGWMAVFIILLVLSCYGAYLYSAYRATPGRQFVDFADLLQERGPLFLYAISYLSSPVVVEFIWSTLLAVLVLIFTFVRRPATAAP